MTTKVYIDDIRTGGKIPTDCELSVEGDFIRMPFPGVVIEVKVEDIKSLLSDEEHG